MRCGAVLRLQCAEAMSLELYRGFLGSPPCQHSKAAGKEE